MDRDTRESSLIDTHVGTRLRLRRSVLKISQEKLGEHLGVSFQQIQKYEKGSNRIGAGQLFSIAKLLKVEPNYFFEGLVAQARSELGFAEQTTIFQPQDHNDATTEGLALNRAFSRIKNLKVRKRIVEMVTAIADTQAHDSD